MGGDGSMAEKLIIEEKGEKWLRFRFLNVTHEAPSYMREGRIIMTR